MHSNVIKGLIYANIIALLLIWLTSLLVKINLLDNGVLIMSDFVVIPVVMGIINAYYWKDLDLKTSSRILYSLYNSVVALICAFFFMSEGYICLLIVSPLILGFLITGVFLGKVMFEKRNNTLNVSVVGLLVAIFVWDVSSEHHHQRMVGDEMIVRATPDKVWKYVVAYEPIETQPSYWLFRIGMPRPVQSTVDGYYEGAGRKCIFNNGFVFDEKMVVFQPNKELTFDIVKQPEHPEIMGHIDIERGQFILKDNGDGTTTLIGNSWYKLHVSPAWYYNLWAESITRNVHLRVMEHIKELSEQP